MTEFCAAAFASHGAHRFRAALVSALPALEDALPDFSGDQAGIRTGECPEIRPLLALDGPIGSIAASTLGKDARPVRALLFDKSPANNWSLGWHQDRTISVKQRREVAAFGPWTWKSGMHHVAPPADLLSRMVTLRVHLDDVPAENAPLLIAPGSHLYGRVAENELDALVEKCGTAICLASAGDVWLYSTLILHASKAALLPARRRVLQVDYAAEPLPGGLEWLEV